MNPLWCYTVGVEICEKNGFFKEGAILYCKIAKIYLRGRYFREAMTKIDNALSLYPDYEDVSI